MLLSSKVRTHTVLSTLHPISSKHHNFTVSKVAINVSFATVSEPKIEIFCGLIFHEIVSYLKKNIEVELAVL